MNKRPNGASPKRPYQKPALRRLAPEEAQARLEEHALRSGTAPLALLHRPPQRGLVR